MDKIWLYVGGIIAATAVLVYVAISFVSSSHQPADDLRASYQTSK